VTPADDPVDPSWPETLKVALDAYAARKGGGEAVAAQDAIHRLTQLNEALLLVGSAALDVAVRQINAPAKGFDGPMDYLELLELIGEVVRSG
jgi:hypothetical protein